MINIQLNEIFKNEGIEFFSFVPARFLKIRRPDILTRKGITTESVTGALMFLIPYFCGNEDGNISLYARSRDYHLYSDGLFSRTEPLLSEACGGIFAGFADKSPIDERDAAARGRLGVTGDSGMLINGKYGSFVFIGEFLTTADENNFDVLNDYSPEYCIHCGACKKSCPMNTGKNDCLSAVTQKKGELSDAEKDYIQTYKSAWGCDICQLSCPLVQKALKSGAETPIAFFREQRIDYLTTESLNKMTDEEFKTRAFSWRGRDVLLRNLYILGK